MKALINAGDNIFDATGLIQRVTAKKGDKQYSGNGVVIFRSNHIKGNAPIFLSYVGKQFIFGEWVDVYSLDKKWSSFDYSEFEMIADESKALIGSIDSILRKECII